jgi:hypothetical protein
MKKIADHDPETFKKMYGDQEGYLSVMKPEKNLTDGEDNTDRGMNKYGLAARHKDGKFHSFRHGKHTGSFDSAEELAKHQKELIQNEDDGDERAISEDAGELARLKELSGIEEGADFYGYYKDPKDPEGKTFTYPNNMEFKTPHRSNANARMLLSRIGLEPDFENTGSHLIDDFIKVTTNWLQTHEADKDTNEYDEVEMYHVEANRIKKTHPEVTHVGFN